VAGRVEQDPDVLLRLELGQSRTGVDRVRDGRVQVDDSEIEVHRHLLPAWLGRAIKICRS